MMSDRQYERLPYSDTVASLEDQLPSLVVGADRTRDSRGGPGRRRIDYAEIEQALSDGASVEDLRRQFGIGYGRALRLRQAWEDLR